MSLLTKLVGIACAVGFLALITFVLFGQITVRKLRKNPKTKDELGLEFMSGWDILNVAQALSIPSFMARKFKDSPLSALHADSDLLKRHTNKFDKVLGTIFYVLFMSSGLTLAFLALLDVLGFFE
ncbi:MAG: hypothetical protein JEZ12_06560 [Desulfobacterium sp.]|nr:hypothetical protein [Desulfobacterium sp.]